MLIFFGFAGDGAGSAVAEAGAGMINASESLATRLTAGETAPDITLANNTTYRLTVVATIFLPLTFITGYFGMNFAWLIKKINSEVAFLALGIGIPVLAVAATAWLIRRGAAPVEPDKPSRP